MQINLDDLNCQIRDGQGDLAEKIVEELITEIEDAGLSLGTFLVGLGQHLSNRDRLSPYNLKFKFPHEQDIGSYLIELGFGFDDVMKSGEFLYSSILGIDELRFAIQSGYIFKVKENEKSLNFYFSDYAILSLVYQALMKKKEILESACLSEKINQVNFVFEDAIVRFFDLAGSLRSLRNG